MALYSSAMDLGLAMPTPAHALTPAALAAVETMRAYGKARTRERFVTSLVTEHGHKRPEPFDGAIVPAGAKTLLKRAEDAGMTAQIVEHAEGCTVEAYDLARGVAFRAHWHRGKTLGASWHEARDRYTLVHDARPAGVNKLTRTGIEGKRAPGLDAIHLEALALRTGLPLNITELTKRVSEL